MFFPFDTNIVHLPGYGLSEPSAQLISLPLVYPQYICDPFLTSVFRMAHLFLAWSLLLCLLPPPPACRPAASLAASVLSLSNSRLPLMASPLPGIPSRAVYQVHQSQQSWFGAHWFVLAEGKPPTL